MNNFDPTNLSDDICELLDLYVIGALDDNEESQVKNILSVSSNAKTYVDEQREVLANLEMDSPSNPALFDSIKNEISKKNEIHNTNNVVSLSTQKLINKSWYNKISYMAVAASVLAVVISASILFTSVNSNTKNEASKTLNREKSHIGRDYSYLKNKAGSKKGVKKSKIHAERIKMSARNKFVRIYCPELDKIFESVTEASKFLNKRTGNISNILKSKTNKTREGLTLIRYE